MAAAAIQSNKTYALALARAAAGALLFALPLLMTMEMWALGASIEPWRFLLYLLASLPLLLGLSYYAGFEQNFSFLDEVLDALAAFGVAFLLSAAVLWVLGVISADMRPVEAAGDIAICAVPASIGALIAGKQLTDRDPGQREKQHAGYFGRLFIMLVGALFLAFNLAPTEEMVLIAYQMNPWQSLVLTVASLGLLHLFVFSLGFPGQARRDAGTTARALLVYSVPGYAIALLVSYFALWTFMRLDGMPPGEQARVIVVLAVPAALGAATARLVI